MTRWEMTNWHEAMDIDADVLDVSHLQIRTFRHRHFSNTDNRVVMLDSKGKFVGDKTTVSAKWMMNDMSEDSDKSRKFTKDYLYKNKITVGEYSFTFARNASYHRIKDRATWNRVEARGGKPPTFSFITGSDNFDEYIATARSIVPDNEALAFVVLCQRMDGDIWRGDFIEDLSYLISEGKNFDDIIPFVLEGCTMPLIRASVEQGIDGDLLDSLLSSESVA